jgi:3-oxoacyl-[acyl-carrier protein] reductase
MKNILICGSSKNLGKYISEQLNIDYNVINISRSISQKESFYKLDLRDEKKTRQIFKKIKKKYKVIDTIIFSVGNSKKNYEENPNVNNFNNAFNDNFFSFVNLINSSLEIFSNNNLNIIAISSIAGLRNINAPITYSLAKNALNFYCNIMAKKLIKNKIRLNVISPGNILIKNNNWDKKIKKNKKKIYSYINSNVPSGKFCHPEEILNVCKLFIENKNNLVGSNIVIDGGQIL